MVVFFFLFIGAYSANLRSSSYFIDEIGPRSLDATPRAEDPKVIAKRRRIHQTGGWIQFMPDAAAFATPPSERR